MKHAPSSAWYARAAAVTALMAVAVGCQPAQPPAAQPTIADRHTAIRERTADVFTRADYFKPNPASGAEDIVLMAPLIVQQRPATATRPARFGGIVHVEADRPIVDPAAPVVYYARASAHIRDREHDQLWFAWIYPEGAAGLRMQGVRMTLDENDRPILWEVLAEPGSAQVIYAGAALERRAAEAFGSSLPGRAHALERSITATREVVVARVLADGPEPMGPWVYMDPAHAVTTVLCRCMPAQVLDFADQPYYDLLHIDELRALGLDPQQVARLLTPPPARLAFPLDSAVDGALQHKLRIP